MKHVLIPVVAKTAKTLAWHGTTSVYLPGILKKGLISGKIANLIEDEYSAISGTYVSLDLEESLGYTRRTKHNAVLILCKISLGRKNVSLDEDALEYFLMYPKGYDYPNAKVELTPEEYCDAVIKNFCKFFKIKRKITDKKLKAELIKTQNYLKEYNPYDLVTCDPPHPFILKLAHLFGQCLKSSQELPKDTKFAVTTPITYNGANKILAIWEEIHNDGETCVWKKRYGQSKYNQLLSKKLKNCFKYDRLKDIKIE